MRSAHSIIINAKIDELLVNITLKGQEISLETASLIWTLGLENSKKLNLDATLLFNTTINNIGPSQSYRDVATLGYLYGTQFVDKQDITDKLLESLNRLSGRKVFTPYQPYSIESDPMAILGIAIGISNLPDSEIKNKARAWLLDFLPKSYVITGLDKFDKTLIATASIFLNSDEQLQISDEIDNSAFRTFLRSKGYDIFGNVEQDEIYIVEQIINLDSSSIGELTPFKSALYIEAYDWILRSLPTINIERPTIEQVASLLKRIPDALRRWTWELNTKTATQKEPIHWDILNEYHVQNLSWFLLSPLFKDLQYEEFLKSLGFKHPKADLCIPSLNLIIELKFIKSTATSAWTKVIDEISADSSQYLTIDSDYKSIIAVVWDNTASSEKHGELVQGLLKISGIKDAIVISRPGSMLETKS